MSNKGPGRKEQKALLQQATARSEVLTCFWRCFGFAVDELTVMTTGQILKVILATLVSITEHHHRHHLSVIDLLRSP